MVGNIDTGSKLMLDLSSVLINQRELIILTFGLVQKPVTIEEAYTFAKNLAARISQLLAYPIPKFSVFRNLISKMVRNRQIKQSYSLVRRKYTLSLAEQGEGEFDYLLHSIANKRLVQIFDEFKSLIELFY